ncbi:flagellar type III secretion system pore protein FliP [Aliikangiella coralliicola]|uniref:Flagellar biosynthetic protein FliP n=1 Tax=Aliikangiella coralliicola TaxID=2592383 RepID=A0A545UB58_9GAMM|nr:flagellar type III secretion system pore protein FliP [Aliikangiella coralliicola]TQV86701.1 flagellar type III secretion system pore protein FliP [Aliikangiella coralliicola]
MLKLLLIAFGLFISPELFADAGVPVLTVETNQSGNQEYSITLQVLGLMTLLTFLPAIVMMMTSFIRVTVVFAILRQALGMQQTPSNQILIGLSLFLTLFIMSPVIEQVNEQSIQPYLNESINASQALEQAQLPFSQFMLGQIRESDLVLFMDLSGTEKLEEGEMPPFKVLVPAFIISELKTAFQIGFLLFIPFLIIDLVIASILMAMGMMMLSPLIISLPFKIMLFVLVDGWALVVGTLANSFL